MAYRPFNNELRDSLYNNDPYIVAHLVKFERASIQPGYSGISSKEATTYTYLTDANFNIDFDDGSFSRIEQYKVDKKKVVSSAPDGIANGRQTYHANKVMNVGTINEGIEAKASSLALELDATSLGILSTANFAFPDGASLANTITMSTEDLSEAGFKEGDKVKFSGGGPNNNLEVLLNRFVTSGGNSQVKVTVVGGTYVQESTASQYSVSQISEELATLVLGNGNVSYTNYINREVTIYRVHLNPETNQIIGGVPGFYSGVYDSKGAMLLFKGIISGATLQERPNARASMSWTLSSHWGDFVRVQNRTTSDESHRALDQDGFPDEAVLIRKEYANDLGFEHSELALNLTATYNRTEQRKRLKKSKNAVGYSKYSEETYYEDIPTDVDLSINLNAKSLPVVYGVQKVDAIPFFFDNFKNKSEQVYVGYALCEGPVAGILDIVIDDKGSLCVDENDSNARSAAANVDGGVDVVCLGRMDAGQALVGTDSNENGVGIYVSHVFNYEAWNTGGQTWGRRGIKKKVSINNEKYWTQTTQLLDAGDVGLKGILHEEAFKFSSPINCTLMFHRGEPAQRANRLLVEKADKNLFKVQNDFYEGAPHQYYTPNHRVLDTAYVVGEYLIAQDETSLPSLDFVVRGLEVDCHNYDGSFLHNPSSAYKVGGSASEQPSDFKIGQSVYLSGHGGSQYQTYIIDKWSYYTGEGVLETRFRWKIEPTSTTGVLIMASTSDPSAGDTWSMVVSDSVVVAGTVPAELKAGINFSATTNTNGVTTGLAIDMNDLADGVPQVLQTLNTVTATTKSGEVPFLSLFEEGNRDSEASKSGLGARIQPDDFVFDTGSSPQHIVGELGGIAEAIPPTDYDSFIINNAIRFGADLLANQVTDDRYEGYDIVLYRFDNANIPYIQTRTITKWIGNGTDNIACALVDEPWDPGYTPTSNDVYLLKAPKDLRVSINPAMQLLDYIRSKRYGKGLTEEEIDLQTFKNAAVACDTRSDITMQFKNTIFTGGVSLPTIGDMYRRVNAGHEHFRGTVKSVVQGTTHTEVVFTDIMGEFMQKWNSYQIFNAGQLLWNNSGSTITVKRKTGSAGNSGNVSTVSLYNSLPVPSVVALSRVGGGNTITPDVGVTAGGVTGSGHFAGDGNPIIKASDSRGGFGRSGYSLYDASNVKYWKYVGWNGPTQRNVTRHQLNHTVDTSKTVFANINDMLKQFNGILRYANGQYQLSVKGAAPTASIYERVSEADIIGDIKLTDKGSKKTYNSISASIVDPANGFEPRQVSFFNSDYLREDNGVSKKGQFQTPAITNYFNARFGLKQYLDESRNGLELQFRVRPSGLLLLAGEVFELTYKRFGWNNKKWRITNLNFLSDGLVAITCSEHSDGAYVIINTDDAGRGGDDGSGGVANTGTKTPGSPTGLSASTNLSGGILLEWANAADHAPGTHTTEIYRSTKNDRKVTGVTSSAYKSFALAIDVNSTADIAVNQLVTGGVLKNASFTSGNYKVGTRSVIQTVGGEDWNTIAGTSGVKYSVGDVITPQSVGAGGNGSAVLTSELAPVKVVSIQSATRFTVNTNVRVANNAELTFGPRMIGENASDSFVDPLLDIEEGSNTFYYWARHRVLRPVLNVSGTANKVMFSPFFPTTDAGIQGIATVSLAERGVSLESSNGSQFFYDLDGTQIRSVAGVSDITSVTLTATPLNTQLTPVYKFEILDKEGNVISPNNHNNGNGAQTQTVFSSTNTFVFTAPVDASDITKAYESFPLSVRVTMKEAATGGDIIKTNKFDFSAAKVIQDGVNRRFVASNAGHIFFADKTGITQNNFSTTVSVSVSGVNYSFDSSTPYGSNTYRFGTAEDQVNCSVNVDSSGLITIAASSLILQPNSTYLSASFLMPIIDNSTGDTIGFYPVYLTKVLGQRADLEFFYDTSLNSGYTIPTAQINNWSGVSGTSFSSNTNNTTLCNNIATQVIADEGSINPGDTVQLISGSVTGTRIYIGPKRTSASGTNVFDWSSPVVKRFDGSVVVTGTLAASVLEADSTITNKLFVGADLELGTSGKIFTDSKTSFGDNTAGVFLGYDTTGNSAYKIDIGDNHNHVRWNGQNLTLKSDTGGFSLKSSTSANERIEITTSGIEIYNSGVIRVKIGDLSP